MSLKTTAFRALSSALYHSGVARSLTALAGYAQRSPAFMVLTFHRVNDEQDPFMPALPTAVFEARMAHIARHYAVLPVEDLVEQARAGRVPRHALAITFDDGYRDNLTDAAPILARYRLPATLFLATGYIGSGKIPWVDELAVALKTAPAERVALGTDRIFPLGGEPQRLAALRAILGHLKGLPEEQRRACLDRLLRELGAAPVEAKGLMLDWEDVRALRDSGFSLGAHTVTHPVLSRVTPERAWEEIHGSKLEIERRTGEPVRAFAYPNGRRQDYTETVKHIVREAGFSCAVTTRRGVNTAQTPPFELRRGGAWEAHLPSYAVQLAYYRLTGS